MSPGASDNNGLSEPSSPFSAPGTPSNEEKINDSSFSPPYPSQGPGTPLSEEDKANEGQVFIPIQPNIFEADAKSKQGQRGGRSPTILVPNLSDTVRQSIIETRSRNDKAIAASVNLGFLVITGTLLSSILLNKFLDTGSTFLESIKEGEEEEEGYKNPSFFVSTNFITPNLKLGAYVVATDVAPQFKKEIKLDVELLPFMVGKVIGILDEAQMLVLIEVFPKRSYFYQSKINYVTPFVYLDDLNPSISFKIKFLLEDFFQIIQDF